MACRIALGLDETHSQSIFNLLKYFPPEIAWNETKRKIISNSADQLIGLNDFNMGVVLNIYMFYIFITCMCLSHPLKKIELFFCLEN